jgi:hypothetical protein
MAALSPRQVERRNRIRAKGRNHYIFYTGILGWGMPVFLTTTIWGWYHHGWRFPPRGELFFSLLFGLVIWTAAGYWVGVRMWKRFFEEPSQET